MDWVLDNRSWSEAGAYQAGAAFGHHRLIRPGMGRTPRRLLDRLDSTLQRASQRVFIKRFLLPNGNDRLREILPHF